MTENIQVTTNQRKGLWGYNHSSESEVHNLFGKHQGEPEEGTEGHAVGLFDYVIYVGVISSETRARTWRISGFQTTQ
jgi:hypothetical protein